MPVTIKIKRRAAGGATGAPSSLASGEIAFNEVTGDRNVYYGAGDNGSGVATSVLSIGGFGSAFTTNVTAFRHDQFAAPTAAVAWGSQQLTGLADGTAANHATSLGQVQTLVQNSAAGIVSKPSCRLVAITAITTSGLAAIDGVTPVAGDRILRAAATPDASNGVWVAASGTWTRATDADQTGEITPGSTWYVSEGTTYGASTWRCANTGTITIGTTAISITQFGGTASSVDGGQF